MPVNKTQKPDWRRTGKDLIQRSDSDREEKRVFYVAVLMPYYSELCKTIYDTCKETLKGDEKTVFVLEKFVANGIDNRVMERLTEAIIGSKIEYSAIIAIGKSASLAAKAVTKVHKSHLPVVFTAIEKSFVCTLVHSSNNSRNNLVGVAMVTPCQFMPIQLLHRVNPKARNFLIPYREEIMFAQMEKNIEECKLFFQAKGCAIVSKPFSGKYLSTDFLNEMKSYDAVIIPEGVTTIRDRDALIDFCNNAKIPVHADGREAIRNGAVFAVTSDVKLIGRETAAQVKAVTAGGQKPSDIKTIVMTHMRKMLYSPENASRLGIVLQVDAYQYMYDTCTEKTPFSLPYELATKDRFVAYCESSSIGLLKGLEVLTQHIGSEVDFHIGKEEESLFKELDVLGLERSGMHAFFLDRQRLTSFVYKPSTPAFFVSGGTALANLIAEMKTSGRHRPITSVQFASSLEQAVGLEESLEHGFRHEATILEPVDPMWAIGYLKAIGRSSIKVAYLLYGEESKNRKTCFNAYLEKCCAAARSLAIDLIPLHVNSAEAIKTTMNNYHSKRNAFLSMAHLIDESLAREMVLQGRELDLLVLAPTLSLSHIAPICIGIEEHALAKSSANFEQYSSSLFIRRINASQLYIRAMNKELLTLMGYEKAVKDLEIKASKIVTHP